MTLRSDSQPVVMFRHWEGRRTDLPYDGWRRSRAFLWKTGYNSDMQESEARRQILDAGKRLAERFFVASNDGNISARIGDDRILVTPTSVNKGDMTPESILTIDMDGKVVAGSLKPSSETKMHLAVYRKRTDVQAIVHAHPPAATGFAACRIRLDKDVILSEVILSLGKIGFAEYATPTTEGIPDAVVKEIADCEAMLLANHGALTVGADVMQAYFRMEVLEMYARVRLATRILGEPKALNDGEIAELRRVKEAHGWGRKPGSMDIDPALIDTIAQIVVEVLKRTGDST
jgi:L-fuculose-phosphate aldolase